MLYKHIAIIIIVSISFYISYIIKQTGVKRLRVYEAFGDFIEYIKSKVLFFCTPTEDIINEYSNDVLESLGFLTLIDDDWENALKESGVKEYIDNITKQTLKSFSHKLGRGSAEEVVCNCDYTIEFLDNQIKKIKGDIDRRNKAYSSVVIISGFIVAILVL